MFGQYYRTFVAGVVGTFAVGFGDLHEPVPGVLAVLEHTIINQVSGRVLAVGFEDAVVGVGDEPVDKHPAQ